MSRAKAKVRLVLRMWLAIAVVCGLSLAGPQVMGAEAAPDFTFSPAAPLAGQSVTFTATGIPQNHTVQWDFQSDGTFDASGTTVRHVYPTSGARTVLMRVTKPGGQVDGDVTHVVRVGPAPAPPPTPPPAGPPTAAPVTPVNRPPVASFTFYPRTPVVGDRVEFVSTSSDPESPIARHAWDLDGDGQFDDASGVSAGRTFAKSGQHKVGLRVTDSTGATDVEIRTLTIGSNLTSSTRLGLMSPFPIVRIVGRFTARGTLIRLLIVRNAPRGARVTVRCRGEGCRRGRQVKFARSGRARFQSFERVMGVGTRIKIFVTQRGKIGKYTAFRIRRMRRPLRRDLCATSARAKPKACPSS